MIGWSSLCAQSRDASWYLQWPEPCFPGKWMPRDTVAVPWLNDLYAYREEVAKVLRPLHLFSFASAGLVSALQPETLRGPGPSKAFSVSFRGRCVEQPDYRPQSAGIHSTQWHTGSTFKYTPHPEPLSTVALKRITGIHRCQIPMMTSPMGPLAHHSLTRGQRDQVGFDQCDGNRGEGRDQSFSPLQSQVLLKFSPAPLGSGGHGSPILCLVALTASKMFLPLEMKSCEPLWGVGSLSLGWVHFLPGAPEHSSLP